MCVCLEGQKDACAMCTCRPNSRWITRPHMEQTRAWGCRVQMRVGLGRGSYPLACSRDAALQGLDNSILGGEGDCSIALSIRREMRGPQGDMVLHLGLGRAGLETWVCLTQSCPWL